jgi:hypothetical protein
MRLTKRGQRVVGVAFIAFIITALGIVGRFDAIDQCAEYQANNDYTAALDAGCSFDANSEGVYPYTWTP